MCSKLRKKVMKNKVLFAFSGMIIFILSLFLILTLTGKFSFKIFFTDLEAKKITAKYIQQIQDNPEIIFEKNSNLQKICTLSPSTKKLYQSSLKTMKTKLLNTNSQYSDHLITFLYEVTVTEPLEKLYAQALLDIHKDMNDEEFRNFLYSLGMDDQGFIKSEDDFKTKALKNTAINRLVMRCKKNAEEYINANLNKSAPSDEQHYYMTLIYDKNNKGVTDAYQADFDYKDVLAFGLDKTDTFYLILFK